MFSFRRNSHSSQRGHEVISNLLGLLEKVQHIRNADLLWVESFLLTKTPPQPILQVVICLRLETISIKKEMLLDFYGFLWISKDVYPFPCSPASQTTLWTPKRCSWLRKSHLPNNAVEKFNGQWVNFDVYTVDGRNPAPSAPVEVGSLSHYLQGFSTIPAGCLGFLNHQQ